MAVSFRSEETRELVRSNVIRPLLDSIEPGVEDEESTQADQQKHEDDDQTWKFKNFDVKRWNSTQEIRLKDDDISKYFRYIGNLYL